MTVEKGLTEEVAEKIGEFVGLKGWLPSMNCLMSVENWLRTCLRLAGQAGRR